MMTNSWRRIIAFVVSVFIGVALSGCTVNVGVPNGPDSGYSASNEANDETSASYSGTQEYVSQMQALSGQELDILTRYDSVTGQNFTDDLTMFNTLMDLLPDLQNFISTIEAIRPTDSKLAALHKTYVEGWNLQAKGMTLAAAALQQQDISKLAEANDYLAQGRSLLASFAQEFASLN
jgi:LysM repeat protein